MGERKESRTAGYSVELKAGEMAASWVSRTVEMKVALRDTKSAAKKAVNLAD